MATKLAYLLECDALCEQLRTASPPLVVHVGTFAEYLDGHIPGAVFVDLAALNSGQPPAGGLLPDLAQLQAVARYLGLGAATHVVAYDSLLNAKAARLLWVLEVLGHQRMSLLNGGLRAWKTAQPLEYSPNALPTVATATDVATLNTQVIADKHYVLASLEHPQRQILDARSAEEYLGLKSAGARAGRIPGAVNLNWLDTIDTDNAGRLKPAAALRALLDQRGIDPQNEIIVHCQTHQRSSHSFVMLRSLGFEYLRGYAGSWAEWSADAALPIERG